MEHHGKPGQYMLHHIANSEKLFYLLVLILHILQETLRLSVCHGARQVRDSILHNFCRLVAYLCCVVLLRQQSGSSGFPSAEGPQRDPRGLPSPRIFIVLGVMKATFVSMPLRPLPGTLACAASR